MEGVLLAGFDQTPTIILRLIHLPPRILYAVGLGPWIGNLILLLTTTGRKSGKRRITPLQYEEIDGRIYLAAARGQKADWIRNISADPKVEVRIRNRRFSGTAEPVTDVKRIADFLEVRLRRHPSMVGRMFQAEGLPGAPDRKALEQYAAHRTMVVISNGKNIIR
jgi:deazaflavin-dependent oxidoreductase (nitroreductase family)